MLEKWKSVLDKEQYVCCLFMDVSKAFDTINHNGFSDKSLIITYLSSEKKVIAGVPQGSIDGPLLFDLFINDLVLFLTQCFLSNYADANNLYNTGNNLELAEMDLQTDSRAITNWFFENYMILNSEKGHYVYIGKNCAY